MPAREERRSLVALSHHLDLVGHQAEPVAEVREPEHHGRAGCCVEDQPDRVLPPTDGERVDLAGWLIRGDRGTDLERVRAEDEILARGQVVGVVLHKGRAAWHARRHGLDRPDQHRCLPVALRPEAVPVGHQALDGEAGQLSQPAQVLEVGSEGPEAAAGEECAQADLDARGVAQ